MLPHLLIGGLVGAAVAVATFPADFIAGTGGIWRRPVYDVNAYLVGWRYLVTDQWRFALLDVPGMGCAEGTAARTTAFTGDRR